MLVTIDEIDKTATFRAVEKRLKNIVYIDSRKSLRKNRQLYNHMNRDYMAQPMSQAIQQRIRP
ncbi:hypothetical protein [Paenibacillus alvei]|uniref:Uncharacterized protein n=1 Tax=Paenibacillus alvei TaxID=44250 RepID=A0A383RMP8_PAEAL|nr:hypothetical protein [Paenibacillus alvei]SYX87659.1 protein of unknown function [Paenibacillus alvei]